MQNPDYVIKSETSLKENINLSKILGKKVISLGGAVIGKVSQIRVNPENCAIEGVIISQGISKPLFIGKSYFKRLSEDAVLLNIDLALLLKGKLVISADGKKVGTVKSVVRIGNTNDLRELVVSSTFSKKFSIKPSDIKSIGKSIILKHGHDGNKKYFWQKSE